MFFTVDPSLPSAEGRAILAALISLTSLTLSTNFFLLFTLVYVDRMRRIYWLVNVVSMGILFIVWTAMLEGVVLSQTGELFVPVFNLSAFGIYLVYILVYFLVGNYNLYRLYRIVRESSKALARRAAGLTVIFSAVLILGLGTNGYFGLTRSDIPPPFSTLLIFLAAAAYYVLYPVGRQRISEALRRFQARRYTIKVVFLTYADGTLIGAKVRPGEKVIDQDLFGATLDVIQNFMRTSFPVLRGKSLSTLRHGNYILIIERARWTYLTVVMEGEESDQLRRQMRDELLKFESQNRSVLANWQGIPGEARGTEELLAEFFLEEGPIA